MRATAQRLGRTLLGAAAVLTTAGAARAGNDDEFLVGNHAAMVGGAVVASVSDGSATYYNPAGVAGVARSRIDVGGSVYALRFHRVDGFLRSAQGGSRDARVREFIAVPTQVTFARRIVEGVTLGLGYFVPRASNIVLREQLDEGPSDAAASYSVNTVLSKSEFVLGAVLGVRATQRLRLGGGVLVTFDDTTESVARFGAIRSNDVVQKAVQNNLMTTQTIVGLTPTLGAQLDVTGDLTVGVAVRAPRLSVFNEGRMRRDSTSTALTPAISDAQTVIVDVRSKPFDMVRAGRYTGGLAYRLDATQLTAEADFQPAVENDAANVRRQFAWNARAGVYHQATARIGMGAGVFTDSETEGENPNALFSMRGDFYGGTLGVRVSNERALAEHEPAESLVFTSVFALKYAFSTGQSRSVLFDRDAAALDQMIGREETTAFVHDVSLYVGSGLHF